MKQALKIDSLLAEIKSREGACSGRYHVLSVIFQFFSKTSSFLHLVSLCKHAEKLTYFSFDESNCKHAFLIKKKDFRERRAYSKFFERAKSQMKGDSKCREQLEQSFQVASSSDESFKQEVILTGQLDGQPDRYGQLFP